MATHQRIPFRRRTFLVKHGFQARFAGYPILLLAAFLLAAGIYLHGHLQEVLRLQLYMPHSRLQDPWQVVAPALERAAGWGGAAFLGALSLWVWRRFSRLRTELDRLGDWLAEVGRGGRPGAPELADPELGALGKGLFEAVRAFDAWEEEVHARGGALLAELGRAREAELDPRAVLREVRRAWAGVRDTVGAVRLEEDLS